MHCHLMKLFEGDFDKVALRLEFACSSFQKFDSGALAKTALDMKYKRDTWAAKIR